MHWIYNPIRWIDLIVIIPAFLVSHTIVNLISELIYHRKIKQIIKRELEKAKRNVWNSEKKKRGFEK